MASDNSDQKRWKDLFEKLDANKDGKIEVSELADALKKSQGISAYEADTEAMKIVTKGDKNESVALDMNEFMEYMQVHEQKLKLAFSDLDKNKDGKIEPAEVQAALGKLGVNIDLAEAEKLTKRLDKDNSLSVSWDEWRNFFQLHSSADLEDMVKFWRKSLMIDIGDLMTVPPEFTKKEKQTGMWWRHLVAGGLAGAVSRTSTAPLDRLKILLQVQGGSTSKLGIVGGLKQMIKEGGVKSLWRGNGTNVIKIAPESAIKFAAYEQLKKVLKNSGETSTIERFAAGSSAGAIAQTLIYPMEVIKTRLAVMKTGEYKGLIDCGLKISKREGLKALYKGYIPNILGIIPYAGIDLTIYETLKQSYLKRHPEQKNPGVMLLLACGTLSSTCGQLATYPLALIRTRLQAQVTSSSAAKQGFVAMTKDIIAREGLWGLYRGIVPNFLKVLPAVSVSYVIYEQTKLRLGIK